MLAATSQKPEVKSFAKPDKVRTFPKGKVEQVKIGGTLIGKSA
jgi:hypothetical protein